MRRYPSSRTSLLRLAYATSAMTLIAVMATTAQAQSLPVGGTAVSPADVTITTGTNSVTVTQTSDRSVINWQSFDVAQGNIVMFNQPSATAATLNRVSGGTASTIAGSITANGSIYLVNPNGIAITASGNVQTGGGFIASTLDITDANFNNGVNSFAGTGASANVSNAGSIASNGFAALLGGTVSNSAMISVPAGRIALASGEAITLNINGGNFLQVAMPTAATTSGSTALIEQSGLITGDRIELTAATAANAVRNVVNMTGTLNANSATGTGGTIVLSAVDGSGGVGGGTVAASGVLSAQAFAPSSGGGTITLYGGTLATAGLTASTAAAAGGTGLLSLTQSNAYTPDTGLGGLLATNNVAITTTAGAITIANPVSWTTPNYLRLASAGDIALNGAISASNTTGALSLSAGGGSAYTGAISASGAVNVGTFTLSNGNWSQTGTLPAFYARDFRSNLNGANFLRTVGGDGSVGNPYRIADAYGLQGIGSVYYLANSFALANAIDASGTALWNAGAGFVPIGTYGNGAVYNGSIFTTVSASSTGFTGILNGGGFTISGLSITRGSADYVGLIGYMNAATVKDLTVTGTVTGQQYTGGVIGRSGAGAGTTISNVTSGITVTGTYATGGLVGFMNAGTITGSSATGTVRGTQNVGGLIGVSTGATVAGSTASGAVTGSSTVGGLIGTTSASVTGSSAAGTVTNTGSNTGGLIGTTSGGGTVSGSSASGSVSGVSFVGGLIGVTAASVTGSSATGNVKGQGVQVGGLIGTMTNSATLSGVYATGSVTGTNTVGGLVGQANTNSTVTNAYATGAVTASGTSVGGLVGQFGGNLNYVYATGAVSTTSTSVTSYVGGLVGFLLGANLRNAYATGAVSSKGGYVGGLVGFNSGGAITWTYATGSASGTMYVGGLIGYNTASVSNAYASGFVSGNTFKGGVFGSNNTSAIGVYWDSYSTGQTSAFGTGTATAGTKSVTSDPLLPATATYAFSATAYSNFTAAANLGSGTVNGFVFLPGNSTRPFLAFEVPVAGNPFQPTVASGSPAVILNSHQLQLIGGYATRYNGNPTAPTLAGSYVLGKAIDLSETARVANGIAASTNGAGTAFGAAAAGSPASYSGMWAATGFVALGTDGAGNVWSGTSFANFGTTGFSGSFAGGGLAISGLTIQRATDYQGLFGYSSGSGSIAALTLTGGSVTGGSAVGSLIGNISGGAVAGAVSSVATNGGNYVGGLIGIGDSTAVSNSSASGAVSGMTNIGGLMGSSNGGIVTGSNATGAVTGSNAFVGGLIGNNAGTVFSSYATGAVSGLTYVGGLIGLHSGTYTVDQTYASGAVLSTAADSYAGGLIGGTNDAAPISRSYATGAVSGPGYNGGLIGYSLAILTHDYATGAVSGGTYNGGVVGSVQGGSVASSVYWDSYSTGQANGVGLIADGYTSAAAAVTSDPAQSGAANYAYTAGAYANLTAADWVFFNGQTRPFGVWEVPVSGGTITNAHQLQLIGTNATTLAGTYTLDANLSLAETGANLGTAATSAGMWSSAGFVPIGTDGTGKVWNATTTAFDALGIKGFSGTLDGAGYTLSGLSVARAATLNAGLFGWTTGTLKNLVMTGGTVSGKNNVGALTGYLLLGTVNNVSISGTTSGNGNVGGIVGLQYKALVSSSTSSGAVNGALNVGGVTGFEQSSQITNSKSSASATATHAYAGGLVGYQLNGTANSNVAASGAVSAPAGAGGLVGLSSGFVNAAESSNTATTTNASATGTVSGTSGTGGLIGYLGENASVSQTYATGMVNGVTNVGGLIGYQSNASVTDSYATGAVNGTTNSGGLVGTIDGAAATIANTYATGAVTSANTPGGLIGVAINGAAVVRSVWDITTTGQSASAGGGGATGYTTAQLQDNINYPTVFAEWDFTNVWLAPNTAPSGHYPRLRIRPTP